VLQPGADLAQLRRDAFDEPDVELRAVAAHQVHLAGQPGQRGQVAQGPAGDDRDGRLRQRRERPDGGYGLRKRYGLGGVLHDRRERAVVVTGDE
jgi:hypothetical protein